MRATENVSEVCRINIFETQDLPIQLYLNMLSYVNHKNKEIEKQYKK